MTLLANVALSVQNYSVAKQATSLPSASKLNSAGQSDEVAREVEGETPASNALDLTDTVSIGGVEQVESAKATQQLQQSDQASQSEEDASFSKIVEESQQSEKERLEEVSREVNEKLNGNLALRFGEDEATGMDYFQLVEKDTGDVVRQIPSEEVLDFMERLQASTGALLSEQA